jgi:GDPmannose 4,6-dehydratase
MLKKKIAFIIGVTGQDGSYLSAFLIKKKYQVFGFTRNLDKKNLVKLSKIRVLNKIKLIKYSDSNSIIILKKIEQLKPREIYYFAGQSSVGKSFEYPVEAYSSNVNLLFQILDFCKIHAKKINIYNSCSTDCFGDNKKIFCDEETEFNPKSPYAQSKAFSFWLVKYYRDQFKLKSCNGILSNHESPLRDDSFVLKKIINFAINPKNYNKNLLLGNTSIFRDWGWAPEYIEAIYKINNAKVKKDYVVGTGRISSLEEIIKKIFKNFDIDKKFILKNNQKLLRSEEIKKIGCKIDKIKNDLNWKPKISINQMIQKLIKNELY